jgi:hypothetical protein
MIIDSSTAEILVSACRQARIPSAGARLLHAHSNTVYVVDDDRVAVRIGRTGHDGLRANTAVAITRWLAAQGLPVTEPLSEHPIRIGDAVVTFWRYYPQPDRPRPPARELGRILRHLHALADPPVELLPYVPLAGLTQVLADPPRTLAPSDGVWLGERITQLIEQYRELDSALGVGPVHGDAYPGNTLWDNSAVRLGDWDEAAVAPRELDLVNTYHGARFGHSESELHEFGLAYGWDVRGWNGFEVLREIRDLHTLTSYIRRAENGDGAAAAEVQHRIRSLRDPAYPGARWHVVV